MGKLIVIEGLDGSGKGTQAALLADYLRNKGCRVREISFPDYDSEGSVLVRMYLDGKLGSDPDATNAYAASMFYAADRYVTYRTDWEKDYADPDTIVIANRYTTANAYHQLSKLPEEQWDGFLTWLWDFEFVRLGLPKPDAVVALSMRPEVSRALIEKRCAETGVKKDIHEADSDYLERCYKALHYVCERESWHLIECADGNVPYTIPVMQEKICRVLGL
jgi:dTMP kinase